MAFDGDERTEIAAICCLGLGSIAAILIAYGRWSDFSIKPVFLSDFQQWHWVRVPVISTLITSLAARAAVLPSRKVGILDNPLSYAMIVVPVVILIMAPPVKSFLAADEGEMMALLALMCLLHGWGFWFLRALFRRGLAD